MLKWMGWDVELLVCVSDKMLEETRKKDVGTVSAGQAEWRGEKK